MRLVRAFVLALCITGIAEAQQPQTLVVGRAVERTLAPGQSHVYSLVVENARFVTGKALQKGVDVEVVLVGPKGDTLSKIDSPNGREGLEPIRFTSAARGTHTIVVRTLAAETGSGQYSLVIDAIAPAATTPAGKLNQLLGGLDPKAPGVAVAVVRDGKIVHQNAWGMANLTHNIPFTVNTRNNIGSTSKQFTALAIVLLASQNKLSLDDDVRKHIPEAPDLGQKVTIRHLVTHTSGYREFLNALALGGRRLDFGDYIARDEILELVKRQPALQNAPGAEFNYNNTGYALLALIVERVSRQTFPDFLQQNVFKPLGMNSTMIRSVPGMIIPNSSQGYVFADGRFREAQDLGASMGAGGIYTTLGDLAKWIANFETRKVGGPRFFDEMTTRNILTKGDTSSYALGLMVDTWRGLKRVRHGGADVAHRSALVYFPEIKAGITVQSNNATINTDSYADQIAEIYFGDRLASPKPATIAGRSGATVDTVTFDRYAGRYALDAAPNFILSFSRRGNRFFTQATGQPEIEIQPTSDSTFTVAGVPASVTFHRDADGSVKRITLNQNGVHSATRVGTQAAQATPNLSDYVGRYFSAELEAFYDIALDGDTLVLRGRRIDPIKLRYGTGDTFAGTFPIASIKFERDSGGKVTGLRAGNGRTRDVLFTRVN